MATKSVAFPENTEIEPNNNSSPSGDKPKSKDFQTCDEALEAVGTFGPYQIYMCVVLQYSAIISAGIFALLNFSQLFPTYHCPDFPLEHEDFASTHTMTYECAVLHNCSNRTVLNRYFLSMTDEWFLVCERAFYLQMILLASAIGRILGSIIGGHIGDRFGRKAVLYPAQFVMCIVSTLSTACTVWYTLTICTFIVGLCYGIGETSIFVLIMEMTSSKHRWIGNSCLQWCVQYPLVALIGYLTGSWRMYVIIINVIYAPLLVFYMIFMESPRFLIYHEQFDRAAKTLSDIASDRWNNRNIDEIKPEQLYHIPTKSTNPACPKCPSPIELIRTIGRAKLTLTLILAMFFRSVLTNLFLQDGSEESGNPFINIALFGAIRIWVPIVIVVLDRKVDRFGRRLCFLIFQGFLLFILVIGVILHFVDHGGVASRVFGLLGASVSSSGSWMSIGQYLIEAYPTAIRGIAYGWIESMDGAGSLVAPYILGLDRVWEQLPAVIMLVLAVATVICGYFVLPETKFKPLTDKVDEFQLKQSSK